MKKHIPKIIILTMVIFALGGAGYFLNTVNLDDEELEDNSLKKQEMANNKIVRDMPIEFQEEIKKDIENIRTNKTISEKNISKMLIEIEEITKNSLDPNSEINKLIAKDQGEAERERGRNIIPLIDIPNQFIYENNLPNKPDEQENKATVLGIDNDVDGIRDDIQILIAYNYQEYPELKNALMSDARLWQEKFEHTKYQYFDDDRVSKLAQKVADASSCMLKASEKSNYSFNALSDESSDIDKIILNTSERRKAYKKISNLLLEQTYTVGEIDSKRCSKL